MEDASALFEEVIAWLRDNYGNYRFYMERDLVWTVQERLRSIIEARTLRYRVFHHFPLFPGSGKVVDCDLALVRQDNSVAVAAEFKYEPSHGRKDRDIWRTKFPVVFWNEGVGHDIERIQGFATHEATTTVYAIFIDEGGFFRHHPPHPGSRWIDWAPSRPGAFSPAVLWACVKA
jgi:hypothetical protein